MTERTITSDDVRCPKCYSTNRKVAARSCVIDSAECFCIKCTDCGCKYEWLKTEFITCTEVPND